MTQKFLFFADGISAWVGKIFAWSILLLTFAIGYEVFSRYVFGRPTTWAFDASYMLYGTLFMMAGAYTLSRNGHVRGDFIYRTFTPRGQAAMDFVLYILFFFPGMIAFIYSGWGFFHLSWLINEHSSFTPAGPPIWPFKGLIPLAGGLMILQGVAETIRCVICMRTGEWPQRLHDVEELEKVLLEEHGAHPDAAHAREAV
ncbi:TRAP transporter small permease subunit [Marinivivus vitaminiproducens]|uniref:TRAP transporter small permease subunit n=1 Tax=Marinivivus vitaminiproducens TaxID=3035935 RepID=UPI0027A64E5C|nr:TRAP transporter small permease subunit [Geminicoccaceae bacterium SCSIO 64248]